MCCAATSDLTCHPDRCRRGLVVCLLAAVVCFEAEARAKMKMKRDKDIILQKINTKRRSGGFKLGWFESE
jgi:hypothetical protein